jgi:hypothetical protein
MSATKEELQKIYLDALSDYKTEIDDDGDVTFRHPDIGHFFISIDSDNDPEYFRMVFPNFADDKRLGLGKVDLLELANEVNSLVKGVKMTVMYRSKDRTWSVSAQVEAFIAPPNTMPDAELVKEIIARYISAIRAGVTEFVREAKNRKSDVGDSI